MVLSRRKRFIKQDDAQMVIWDISKVLKWPTRSTRTVLGALEKLGFHFLQDNGETFAFQPPIGWKIVRSSSWSKIYDSEGNLRIVDYTDQAETEILRKPRKKAKLSS